MISLEFLTVEEVQQILKIGKNQAYKLTKRGDFPSLKVGKQHRIPKEEFRKWCERQAYKEM